jgi:hypothetical protein
MKVTRVHRLTKTGWDRGSDLVAGCSDAAMVADTNTTQQSHKMHLCTESDWLTTYSSSTCKRIRLGLRCRSLEHWRWQRVRWSRRWLYPVRRTRQPHCKIGVKSAKKQDCRLLSCSEINAVFSVRKVAQLSSRQRLQFICDGFVQSFDCEPFSGNFCYKWERIYWPVRLDKILKCMCSTGEESTVLVMIGLHEVHSSRYARKQIGERKNINVNTTCKVFIWFRKFSYWIRVLIKLPEFENTYQEMFLKL